MITGVVNTDLEATLRVAMLDANGEQQPIEAIIDTGFTGFLTLPLTDILSLGLLWLGREEGVLANGSTAIFDVHQASVLWNDQPRMVLVEAADTEPLLGMRLLQEHALSIEVVVGGTVTITPRE